MDTFARNEGDSGGKAHFKFVFTLDDGTSLSGESQDGSVASTSSLSLLSYSSTSTRIASGECCGVCFHLYYKVGGVFSGTFGVVWLGVGDFYYDPLPVSTPMRLAAVTIVLY